MHFSTQYIQKSDNAFVTKTSITTKKSVSCNKKFQKWALLEKQKGIIIKRYIGKVFDGFKKTNEINEYTGLPVTRATYRNAEVCDFQIMTYELYDYREPIIHIISVSFFIPFLINLLIIGYVWRFAFMLIVWSIKTISQD